MLITSFRVPGRITVGLLTCNHVHQLLPAGKITKKCDQQKVMKQFTSIRGIYFYIDPFFCMYSPCFQDN